MASIIDPTNADFNLSLPYNFGVSSVTFDPEPIGSELGDYEAQIDGKIYFVTLSYKAPENDNPYMLTARVAWSRATGTENLQWVDVTSYGIY